MYVGRQEVSLIEYLRPLGAWNYLLLAILVFLEGPTVTLLAATASVTGAFHPGWVFLTAASSNLAADVFWYFLGWLGKTQQLVRLTNRLGVRQTAIQRFVRGMHVHALKILLMAKLTMSFSIPALIAAGLARVSWRRVLAVLLPAETVWTGALVLIGFYLGQWLPRLERGLQIVVVLGSAGFLLFLLRLIRKHFVPE